MLDNSVLYVTGLAGLDRLRAVEAISSDACPRSRRYRMRYGAFSSLVEHSPIASRIDGVPVLVLE
jgi:hypothetical protein